MLSLLKQRSGRRISSAAALTLTGLPAGDQQESASSYYAKRKYRSFIVVGDRTQLRLLNGV